jgi:hypothetical protein
VARARKFYEETLGLKSGLAGNRGDNWWVEYDLPGGGCLALANFTKEKPSDTAGGTIALEVEDFDRLMTTLPWPSSPRNSTTRRGSLIRQPYAPWPGLSPVLLCSAWEWHWSFLEEPGTELSSIYAVVAYFGGLRVDFDGASRIRNRRSNPCVTESAIEGDDAGRCNNSDWHHRGRNHRDGWNGVVRLAQIGGASSLANLYSSNSNQIGTPAPAN